jgi:hypothetical protein
MRRGMSSAQILPEDVNFTFILINIKKDNPFYKKVNECIVFE